MTQHSLALTGLEGTNPLGFLAALGTLVTLHRGGEPAVRLRWQRSHTWVPVLEDLSASDEAAVSETVAVALRGRPVSSEAAEHLQAAQKAMDTAKTAVKKKGEEIKGRRLGRSERQEVEKQELLPLKEAWIDARRRWLAARRAAVPWPELSLGKRIEDCGREEYRELVPLLADAENGYGRSSLELLAALGSDACLGEEGRIDPTPFEFTRGSGHQFFLETVRQLVEMADGERVRRVLFEPWDFRDEGLSLRWDPSEDRRYALLDRDPTAGDNKPRTVWMANLLAYRSLALFPTAPTLRSQAVTPGGLAVTGWSRDGETLVFTWPLWEFAATPDTVRTILQTPELARERPDMAILRARGIAAVYRSQRVKVGRGIREKLNFSPARQVV